MENLIQLVVFCVLCGLGFFIGSAIEKKHYASIAAREASFLNLPAVTAKNIVEKDREIDSVRFVSSNIVLGADYFKLVLAGLRNLLGGEVSAFESILDRGRREALLRMKEKAVGADIILNTRLDTCQVLQTGTVEIFAYGTAVFYKKNEIYP